MQRKDFLKTITLLPFAASSMKLNDLKKMTDEFGASDRMPALFIGHGSPMNGIEDTEFSERWKRLGSEIPRPRAVVCVSAHWLTRGTFVTAMTQPKTIHDFGGFPKALFDVQYPAPGSPEVAAETKQLVKKADIGLDHDWGLDHGTWTVVRRMFPDADIPVLQLSIDYHKPPQYHYELAQELAALREKGVLVIGSGNMVHNLRMVDFSHINEPGYGFDWAHEMNTIFKQKIGDGDHAALVNYQNLSKSATLAIPTPDHYYPLLYILGIRGKGENPEFFNDKAVAGSLTMTSVRFG